MAEPLRPGVYKAATPRTTFDDLMRSAGLPGGTYKASNGKRVVYPNPIQERQEAYEVTSRNDRDPSKRPYEAPRGGGAYNPDIPSKRRVKAQERKGSRTRYNFERALSQYDPRYVKRNNNLGRSQIPAVIRGVCTPLNNTNTVTGNMRDTYDNKSMWK